MRDWYRGCALVFQTREISSSLISRSTFFRVALVAQWLEQRTHNPLVTGSSPVERTMKNTFIPDPLLSLPRPKFIPDPIIHPKHLTQQ